MVDLRRGTVKRIGWWIGAVLAPLLALGVPATAQAAPSSTPPVEVAAGISTEQMLSILRHLMEDHGTAADAKVTLLTQDIDRGIVRSRFAVGAVADGAKTSNPFEVPTMTTFARPDGTVLVRTYRAITASEGAAEEGVVLEPTSYVLASDGTTAGVAPPGGALHVRGLNGLRGDTTRYSSLTPGPYGWQ